MPFGPVRSTARTTSFTGPGASARASVRVASLAGDVPRASSVAAVLAGRLLDEVTRPGAVVRNAARVVAANAAWRRLVGRDAAPGPPSSFARALAGFAGRRALLASLRRSGAGGGCTVLRTPDEPAPGDAPGSTFEARWSRIEMPGDEAPHALVLLEPISGGAVGATGVPAPVAHADRMLVRRTLIEEGERRRIGRALHDRVTQSLVLVRRRLTHDGDDDRRTRATAVAALDEVITSLRELSFALSPPVLEDLGLVAALHWLAEYVQAAGEVVVECVDDEREPPLSAASRTIVFGAVRELAANAVKHARAGEIVISCRTSARHCRLMVRDDGVGFAPRRHPLAAGHRPRYGLQSVEQQVRAIGGVFELVSVPGEGTRAVITLPVAERAPAIGHVDA